MSRRFPYLLFWFLALVDLSAQVPLFQFKHLGTEDGLTNNSGNYFISEDSRGFIWISSLNGFYRYDGLRLKHYLIPANEAAPFIPDQVIQSAFWEDQESNLWFTTYNSLHCLARKTGAITHFRALEANGQKASHSYHIFFMEDGADRLWLRAGDKVWTYNTETGRWAAQFPSQGIRFCAISDTSGTVRTVISCPWLKGPVTTHRLRASGDWVSESYLGNGGEIRSALLKNDSTAWLFSNTGLLEFNFITGRLCAQYTHTQQGLPLNLYNGTYAEGHRFLLLAAHSAGVLAFDTWQKRFAGHWGKANGPGAELVSNAPRTVFWSEANQLWIGHKQGGVDFSQFRQRQFENPLISVATTPSRVAFILEDGRKNIWLLTAKGEIYQSVGGNAPLQAVKPPPVPSPLTYLTTDHSGTLWGINDKSIFRLKAHDANAEEHWEAVFISEKNLVSIFLGVPGKILVISREGVFDLVERGEGYRLQPSEEFIEHPGFHFYHFYQGRENMVLIPFESNELWVAKVENQSLKITTRLMIGGDTNSAYFSPDGDSIWLGSNLGLMLYTQGKTDQVLPSTERLGGAGVFGVIGTEDGSMWLSTSHGLKKYEPGTRQLTSFYQADGLASEQFSPYAHLRASDGRIWLGTSQGLTVFHPDSIQFNTPPPRAHLEAFWVNNVPFETELAISETDMLQLNYRENTLSFELRAVNFHQPELNTLSYRLLGYDDDWASVPNGGYARFTKIPPGQYTLEILPLNANGQAGPKHTLSIGIQPPFWQTLWFKAVSVLAVLLLVAGIVGAYYRRKLRKQRELLERQQALNQERNRIAKELHDDMGSSLSSILFLSEDLLLETDEARHEVERISSLAETSLENMREIIWAMDTDKNTLQDLSIRLRAFATDFLGDHKVRVELDFPSEPLDKYVLGGERRRNSYLIAKEALHNAVKHAGASLVQVSLKLEGPFIVLEIKDDGQGFDEQALAAAGHGLNNMKGRAEAVGGHLEIQSRPGKGARLRLAVPL